MPRRGSKMMRPDGSTNRVVAENQRDPSEGSMGKLSTSKRNALPKSSFGQPGSRKYPMPDKSHARNAKARASQQVKKGNLSKSSAAKIDAKADKILGKKKDKY